jgi:hypothetical protein
MKRLILVFGGLDAMIVLMHLNRIPYCLRDIGAQPFGKIGLLIAILSFGVSAIGFFRAEKWVYYLSYAQFPVRIVFALFSLTFVAKLILPEDPSVLLSEGVWMSCAAIEGIRLGLTIMLHRESRLGQSRPIASRHADNVSVLG